MLFNVTLFPFMTNSLVFPRKLYKTSAVICAPTANHLFACIACCYELSTLHLHIIIFHMFFMSLLNFLFLTLILFFNFAYCFYQPVFRGISVHVA